MKANHFSPFILLILSFAALSWLAACSPLETGGASASAASSPEDEHSNSGDSLSGESPAQVSDRIAPASAPAGMVALEGDLFVATTKLSARLWKKAGWQIAKQPVDTDTQELPSDCTLYPHQGVENQWVGRCRGYTLIPQSGAEHISVLITNSDGSTKIVQVAP